MKPRVLIVKFPPPLKGSLEALSKSLPLVGYEVRETQRDVGPWRDVVNGIVRDWKPHYCIAFQRFYSRERIVTDCLSEYGVRTLFADFGIGFGQIHYDNVIFDTQGENAESQIRGNLDALLDNRVQLKAANKCDADIDKRANDIHNLSARALPVDGIPNDYVLYLFQRTGDQVLRYDSRWPNTMELAQLICPALGQAKRFGVLKPHPWDASWDFNERWRNPGKNYVALPKYNLKSNQNDALLCKLIINAERVCVVNSTTQFNAMMVGKPVMMLGSGWATGNRVVTECKEPIDTLRAVQPVSDERRRAFLSVLLSRHRNEKDLRNPTVAGELMEFFHNVGTWTPLEKTVQIPVDIEHTITVESPSIGIAYVAMGRRYFDEFQKAYSALRTIEKDVPVALLTNCNVDGTVLDSNTITIPLDMLSDENRNIKTSLPSYVPFERTLYMDVDTIVQKPIGEIWRYLDSHDMVFSYDTLKPTHGVRADAGPSPLTSLFQYNDLVERFGRDATLPQCGFFAYRRNDRTKRFFNLWNDEWKQNLDGDEYSFTLALWASDIRYHTLVGPIWQRRPGGDSVLGHNWGCLCRQKQREPEAFCDDHLNLPPVLTPIYIPQSAERYSNEGTENLVKRCIGSSFRALRFIGLDQTTDSFTAWSARMGHRHFVLPGKPPRMNMYYKAMAAEVNSDLLVTQEQDCICPYSTIRGALDEFASLPDNVAALFLYPKDEKGQRTHPLVPISERARRIHYIEPYKPKNDWWVVDHAPFNCTIWRTEAFRQIDFASTPPHGMCDLVAGKQLMARGWKLLHAGPELSVVHYPHSSYTAFRLAGKE